MSWKYRLGRGRSWFEGYLWADLVNEWHGPRKVIVKMRDVKQTGRYLSADETRVTSLKAPEQA